ncbi:hypothetical protein HNQ77_004845 [Silvibacterium bohemicum]|uniref:VWA domain-containing protein n=1 Tax=Silvibacterium bohemicum TaxID=1577686 RepID=A0A841K995_9BACT|nr:VWA domain-containing protein [Silvibacterium bohemicum]MBB6146864.1 hypothetical protein [Silvibacterium bohemicum]
MSNEMISRHGTDQTMKSLDAKWRLMNAALEKLGQSVTTKPLPARRTGHLLVALDLTGSRAESLKQARKATAAMFEAIRAIGSVAVKLAYYRGSCECKAGAWHDDAEKVCRSMLSLSCESGETQIARVLRLALSENEKLSGLVFIGDHCEERPEQLLALAETLGTRSLPLFIFHECADHDAWSLQAKPLFERMAKLSGGVYVEFKPDSGAVLKELLSSIAALSVGGVKAVERMALPTTSEGRQLRGRLLLGSGNGKH